MSARYIPAALAALALAGIAATAAPAQATTYPRYANCTALNAKYPHGVGKTGARDHVTSGKPVTTFYVSTGLYTANARSDRDHDGIACEKK